MASEQVKQPIGMRLRAWLLTQFLKSFRVQLIIAPKLGYVGRLLHNILFSVLGTLIALGLTYYLESRLRLVLSDISALCIASGAVIATIMALVFSLSIIPIQRASETLTPAIGSLHRINRTTRFIFVVLGILSLLSFLLPTISALGIQASLSLAIQVMMLSAAFDLVRWHFRHLTLQLDLRWAIAQLWLLMKREIDGFSAKVARLAKLQKRLSHYRGEKIGSSEQIEGVIWRSGDPHVNLRGWIDELTEAGIKAVARGDIHAAQMILNTLSRLHSYYLDRRKLNLVLLPDPAALMLITKSDVDTILTPIYESLRVINRAAVNANVESICMSVIEAYGNMGAYTAGMEVSTPVKASRPFTSKPLGYMRRCAEDALKSGLDESGLSLGVESCKVVAAAPYNVQILDVVVPTVEGCFQAIAKYLTAGKVALANRVLENVMQIGYHLVDQKHFQAHSVVSDILERNLRILPMGLLHSKLLGEGALNVPLSPPYNLTFDQCLGRIVQLAAVQAESARDKGKPNVYTEFLQLNEGIYRHFGEVANSDQIPLEDTFLYWQITQTIKQISDIYLSLISGDNGKDKRQVDELVKQMTWYIRFFWLSMSRMKSHSQSRIDDTCEALSWIGISNYQVGGADVTEACLDAMSSISVSVYQAENPADIGRVVSVLEDLYKFRVVAEKNGDASLVKLIDAKLEKISHIDPAHQRDFHP